MTNQPTNANVGASTGAPKRREQTPGVGTKQAPLADIRMKWDKFTDQELGDLRTTTISSLTSSPSTTTTNVS